MVSAPIFISLKELSALLGLSQSAIRFHVRRGRITPTKLGRRLLFNRDEILKELKKGSRNGSVVESIKG